MSGGAFLENGRPSGTAPGVYSLRWNSFQSHLTKGLSKLLGDNSYTDVTLACEGSFLKAHKLLLSICSPFFKRLFDANDTDKFSKNTIVILNNVRFKDLENIIRFIYNGQTNVNQTDLHNFLETGELLQIEGLASCSTNQTQQQAEGVSTAGVNTTTNSQLPPLPTLHSVPPPRSQNSGAVFNANIGVNTTTMDSRLRASLTNANPLNSPLQMHSTLKPTITQQQLPLTKRPRLANPTHDMTTQGSSSKLQSILTGQSYMVPTATGTKPSMNSVRSPSESIVNIDKDPLEQDDVLVHLDDEEADNIECEPLIQMDSGNSEQIEVFSLEDDDKEDVNISEGEDEFEDSHQEVMDQDLNNQDLYRENMEAAGRKLVGPSTSQTTSVQLKRDKQAAAAALNERNAGALKKTGRKPKHKYRACTYCGGLFYRSNLSRHMNQVHAHDLLAQGKRLFRCGVCRTLYRSTAHLQTHMQKQHGDFQEL